jgi:hypothetical protein
MQFAVSNIKSRILQNKEKSASSSSQTENNEKEKRKHFDGQIFDLNYFKRIKEVKIYLLNLLLSFNLVE